MTPPARRPALDGLRGLAALAVVFHHSLLVSPAIYREYVNSAHNNAPLWVGVITHSPLHLLWAGPEAVVIFFVLSGYVLTLPYLKGLSKDDAAAYYPRRIARLYLPTIAAIGVSVILTLAFTASPSAHPSGWIRLHDQPITGVSLVKDLTLWHSSTLDTPLWSLHWEILFSLLLPLYVFVVVRFRRIAPLLAIGALAASAAGARLGVEIATYMPVFALGALLATCGREFSGVRRFFEFHRWAGVVGATAAGAFMTVGWVGASQVVSQVCGVMGATLLVALFLVWRPAELIGTSRPIQWLGTRSFSLYLIHEPIVVAVAKSNPSLSAGAVFAIAFPIALISTELFFRLVERPSITFSRNLANRRFSRHRTAPEPGEL